MVCESFLEMKLQLVSRLASRVCLTSILLAVVALARGSRAGTLDLAVRGRAPEYAIVRAADASPSVKYAAEELRDFTERMTGVRLPIVTDEGPLPPKAIVLGAINEAAVGWAFMGNIGGFSTRRVAVVI